MNPRRSAVVSCSRVSKSYADGEREIAAIQDVSVEVHEGTLIAIVGPSGSGKTTLLHLIGGVERADAGSIVVAGVELARLNETEQAAFRAEHVSFVFADLNLLPVLSVYENISLGLDLLRLDAPERHRRTLAALDRVGLAESAHRLPATLSSGERQRAAIARAIARESLIVVADEPTAHLDHDLAARITDLLRDLAADHGSCVFMATHDPSVAARADRVISLQDGRSLG